MPSVAASWRWGQRLHRRFGGQRVTQADVLNIDAGDPETTIVADLAEGQGIPSTSFDCL